MGPKAFREYEGSGVGSGNDRKKERETTTGIYRTSAIFILIIALRADWAKGSQGGMIITIDWGRSREIFECQAKKPSLHKESNNKPLKVVKHL